jgi:hypothetical protein
MPPVSRARQLGPCHQADPEQRRSSFNNSREIATENEGVVGLFAIMAIAPGTPGLDLSPV